MDPLERSWDASYVRPVFRARSLRVGFVLFAAAAVVGAEPALSRVAADTTSPTLSIPDVSASATSDCGSTFCASVDLASYEVTSDPDNTPAEISVRCNTNNGSTFVWGTSMVTCQAFDPAGNFSAPVSFTVTVSVSPPTFQNVPGPITFAATGAAGAVATFVPPTAIDVGGQSVPVSCDHPSGITYPVGTTTVTCTAKLTRPDSLGNPINVNSASAQFTITITPASSGGTGSGGGGSSGGGAGGGTSGSGTGGGTSGGGGTSVSGAPAPRDTTAPTIGALLGMTVDATSAKGAPVSYTVTATDPDTPSTQITIACLPQGGSLFPLGPGATTETTTVVCRATDPAGNQSAPMSFPVTVLGLHAQLLALERGLSSSTALSKRRKTPLIAMLVHADRDFAADATARARKQLSAFTTAVQQLPIRLGSAPTAWLATASRVRHLIN